MLRFSLFLFASMPFLVQAQHDAEQAAVRQVIQTLFDGMRAGDTNAVKSVFLPTAILQTALEAPNGDTQIKTGGVADFVRAVGMPHDKVWDERIFDVDVHIDGPLASAWADYTFFLGSDLNHCGIDHFLLVKQSGQWKISLLTDTRRKQKCQAEAGESLAALHAMIDGWHRAAATADENVFFGSMAPDAIYLGTDATERWLRDELRTWAAKAFDRVVAWDFTPFDRHAYFSADGQHAWWEENLRTWMGICRGSGVAEKSADGWKIKHYHLSVTVPNEKIKGFIELLEKK